MSRYPRPRKNPGGKRPVAVLRSGQVIEKVTLRHIPEIQRLSLLGAFRYVEIAEKHSRLNVRIAKLAFCKVSLGQNGYNIGKVDTEIERIDQDTYDSRQIDRNLRAAAKKLRKAGKSDKSASTNQTQES